MAASPAEILARDVRPYVRRWYRWDRGYSEENAGFHRVPGGETGWDRSRLGRHGGTPVPPVGTTLIRRKPFEYRRYPLYHLQRDYVLNSGTGEFGRVDPASGRFEPIAFLSGYGRGLAFAGPHHAVVGLSEPRENRTFAGLGLQERLERERMAPRCGLMAVDLRSGDVVHWLRIEGVVRELYDVALLPGRRNPAIIGFRSDEIRRTLSVDTDLDAAATSHDTRSHDPRSRTDPIPG
jgi:Domain of unknown function (DUF4915)